MANEAISSSCPIGVFDSGLGGLTAIRELEKLLPEEDIVYFGDTGRVPYGTKSKEIIQKFAGQAMRFLQGKKIKAVLAACGTISSVASSVGENIGIPFFDVLHATSIAAANTTKNKRVGVIATPATVASGAYRREIQKIGPSIQVFELACPMFVPLVENGYISPVDDVVRLVVQRSLAPMKENNIDTLILGCTHFPVLYESISHAMGAEITLINSGKEAAIAMAAFLKENHLLNQSAAQGNKSFYVSDKPQSFSQNAGILLGHDISSATQQIDIEQY